MLTVGQLTEFAELHCDVVAGAEGTANPIAWAHSCELVDPTPWLMGGELVMTTGQGIPGKPEAQVAYLERLAAHGVAGLAIGDRRIIGSVVEISDLSDAFYAAAERLALPIVRVTGRTPFVAIAQRVAAANQDAVHERMARHLRVYETLGRVARAGMDVADCIRRLSEVAGYELSVVSPAGKPLFEGIAQPAEPIGPSEIEDALADGDFAVRVPQPVRATADRARRTFLVPIIANLRPVGVLVASADEDGCDDRLVLHHIATIVSLLAAEVLRERERERREGSELLARLLFEAERDGPRTIGAAFPTAAAGTRFALAAATVDEDAPGWNAIHHRLVEHGFPNRLTRAAGRAVIAVALGQHDLDALGHVLSKHLPDATIGISSVLGADADLITARREARWAVRCAIADGRRVQLHASADEPGWLLRDTSGLELMVNDILGRLVEHDERTGGELERTLEVFLECNGGWKVTSERLFIHRQTLIHRVKRIEQLTGRRVGKTDELCDLWLAVKARRSLIMAGALED